jgi:hypothetical protein
MFGIFKKKKSNERDGVIEEFNSMINQTKTGKEDSQMLIGHGVNVANSIFLKAYSSPDDFRGRSYKEKFKYFKKFIKFKEGVKEKDFGLYIGIHFFGTWLLALVQDDNDLENLVKKELVWLSKKGEPLGGQM